MSHVDPLQPLDLSDPIDFAAYVDSATIAMLALYILGNRADILGDQLAQQLEEIEQRNERLIDLNEMNTLLQAMSSLIPPGSVGTFALPDDLESGVVSDNTTTAAPVVLAASPTRVASTSSTDVTTVDSGTGNTIITTTTVVIDLKTSDPNDDTSTTTTRVLELVLGKPFEEFNELAIEVDTLAAASGITPIYANKTDLVKSIGSIKTNVDSLTQSNQMDMIRLQSMKDKMLLAFEQITALLSAEKTSLRGIVQNWT